jgi:hypothetical protein
MALVVYSLQLNFIIDFLEPIFKLATLIIIVVNPQVSDRQNPELLVLLKSFVFTLIFLLK